jgi:hypothetical protein
MGVPFGTSRCVHIRALRLLIRYKRSSFEFAGGFTTAVDLIEDVALYGDSHLVPPQYAYDSVPWTSILFLSFVSLYVICTKYFSSIVAFSETVKRKIH